MLRLAVSQFRPTKGEYAQNVDRIAAVLAQAMALEVPPALVVFPETATSGYFVEGGVKDVAVTAGTLFRDLRTRYEQLGAPAVDVAVGFYELFQNHIFNSCLYASLATASPGIRHVHRKIFLPTYGVFDEDGTRLPASMVRWERVVRGIAEEHGVFVVLANLVGFEGGKGFPGASAVLDPSGGLVVRGPLFEEGLITADLDLEQITHARVDSPLLADLQKALPNLLPSLGKGDGGRGRGKTRKVKFDPAANGTPPSPIPHPPSPVRVVGGGGRDSDPLDLDCPLVHKWLVAFLKDEVVRRRGFTKGIVGVSGGVDSSLTAFLAAEALGKDNVIGVRMPYRTSSPESLAHAQLVIDKLGIRSLTLDISAAVDGYLAQIGSHDPHRIVTPH